MKRFHVRNSMKKVLAFSLATAMVVPGIAFNGSIDASAEAEVSVPTAAKTITLERGFVGDGLTQAKLGAGMIGYYEDDIPAGQLWAGNKYFSPIDGRLTGQYKKVDTVLVQGTFDKNAIAATGRWKGYEQAKIPAGAEKQNLPDLDTNEGDWAQFNPAWNQPTAAYDAEKGMVFWMDDTLEIASYPTYATTVDREAGTWDTKMSLIVKDTKGQYQEFEIQNSAAEFASPFAKSSASGMTGLTFSAWIKNTTPYKAPVVYGKLGDLNGSGGIDVDDALVILKHIAEIETLSESGKLYADVNGKDGVSVDDALDILKVVAEIMGENEFTGSLSAPVGGEEETVAMLEDSEFFHVERRVLGNTVNSVTGKSEEDERNIQERQYLYFSGNGVTYVGDFKDPESACTWTLNEEDKDDETVNLLSGKNGGKWNYVSYTFDGEDFSMYINGKKVPLVKDAGENYSNDIISFVKNSESKTYLGGRGGGVEGNFNTFAIKTSDDYYMDDIAIYTEGLGEDQTAAAYAQARKAFDDTKSKSYNVMKTYSFEGATLAENQLVGADGSSQNYWPSANETGKSGKGLKLKKSNQMANGGVQLPENPFAGKSNLSGVSISYWMKSVADKRGTVTDGVLLSFVDDEKLCQHEKGGGFKGKSQLYLNQAFIGQFCQGANHASGTNLGNTYTFKPYRYGDPDTITEEWKKQFAIYYDDWVKLRNSLAANWNFITVTFNNAGFAMYLNGEAVENKCVDFKGQRFCDYYWGRTTEITRKATNNAGARSLMDFLTAADTKVYVGYAYQVGSAVNYERSQECYLDELTFYDKDLTAAEVRALYNQVK